LLIKEPTISETFCYTGDTFFVLLASITV